MDLLDDNVHFYKIGAELFFKTHFEAVRELKARGKKIFLDLKLNDIPRTISVAVTICAEEKVDYISLFTSQAGIKSAKIALGKKSSSLAQKIPKIFNVTVLTSDECNDASKNVLQRSQMSKQAGADGVICSGLETKRVKDQLSPNFLVINPGVRMNKDQKDDQKRVVSPKEAYWAGADHIVMGRPIYLSEDPRGLIHRIFEELS